MDLAPRPIVPIDGYLFNTQSSMAGEHQDLHVKGELVKSLVGKEADYLLASVTLEATLCVP